MLARDFRTRFLSTAEERNAEAEARWQRGMDLLKRAYRALGCEYQARFLDFQDSLSPDEEWLDPDKMPPHPGRFLGKKRDMGN